MLGNCPLDKVPVPLVWIAVLSYCQMNPTMGKLAPGFNNNHSKRPKSEITLCLSVREKTLLVTLSDEVQETYLAALTGTDTIVVSRGLVLADEAGLVDSRRGQRGRRAGDEFLRTGALRFNGCRECRQELADNSPFQTSE